MTLQGLVLSIKCSRYHFRIKRIITLFILLFFVILVWFKVSDNSYSSIKLKKNQTNSIHKEKEEQSGILYLDYVKIQIPITSNIKTTAEIKNASKSHLCPACYGKDYCKNLENHPINEDAFKVLTTHSNQWEESDNSLVWLDVDNLSKMQLSRIRDKEWDHLQSFICQNSSLPTNCQPSVYDIQKVLGNPGFITLENIANLYKAIDKMKNEIPLLVCATKKLLDHLKKAFDADNNGVLNRDERSIMLTSILTHQSYVLMKFRKQASININIPKVLGACGRLVFREKDWTPLTNVLDEPFEVRAGIALQILQTVEDLQDEDPDWYFFNTDFTYKNLMRSSEGDIILTNLEDLAIVDKSLIENKVRPLLDSDGELCNELCFQRFTRQILDKNLTLSLSMCSKVGYYGQLMQALVCKQLFSDLEEHKSPGFFNFDGNRIHKKSTFPGLLHSIPEKDRETIEDLLRECVQETNISGRKQAIDELREILEKYLNYDDKEEKVDNRNEDDDENNIGGR